MHRPNRKQQWWLSSENDNDLSSSVELCLQLKAGSNSQCNSIGAGPSFIDWQKIVSQKNWKLLLQENVQFSASGGSIVISSIVISHLWEYLVKGSIKYWSRWKFKWIERRPLLRALFFSKKNRMMEKKSHATHPPGSTRVHPRPPGSTREWPLAP